MKMKINNNILTYGSLLILFVIIFLNMINVVRKMLVNILKLSKSEVVQYPH